MKEEKTGFVYIWYDKKRKMFYIGCHVGKEDDGYICSSRRMRDVYRRRSHDFKRRILNRDIPKDQLLAEEHKWLDQIKDDELGKKYYNLSKHHFGHWITDAEKTISVGEKISKANKGKKHPNRKSPPPLTEEQKKARSQRLIGNKHSLGRNLTKDHKKKISEKIRGINRSEETKAKIAEAARKQHAKRR